jgi:type I restriction enzyme R subunit
VRWRENIDAQNRMRNALDDYLYDMQKAQGIQLSFEQMDTIIESVIRIAIHRTDDI